MVFQTGSKPITSRSHLGVDRVATAVAFAGVLAFAALIAGLATALTFTSVLTFAGVLGRIRRDHRAGVGRLGRRVTASHKTGKSGSDQTGGRGNLLSGTVHDYFLEREMKN
jgi:hypothetical protein